MRLRLSHAIAAAAVIGIIGAVATAQERPMFRAGTRLTTVDVLVDKDGRPVADLTEADFAVQEDGKNQRIAFFRVIDTSRPAAAVAVPPAGSPGIREVTNRPGGQVPLTATIVLFDRLNTRFEDGSRSADRCCRFGRGETTVGLQLSAIGVFGSKPRALTADCG